MACDNAGAGMILRDEFGKIIFSACRAILFCRDALEAELYACLEGLSSVVQRTSLSIHVEMDSSVAVSKITGGEVDRSLYSAVVNEIRGLINLHQACITHIACS